MSNFDFWIYSCFWNGKFLNIYFSMTIECAFSWSINLLIPHSQQREISKVMGSFKSRLYSYSLKESK